MSMTFYCYREINGETEFADGPNFANTNACMILRSLDLDAEQQAFDAADMLARVTMARAVSPVDDSGMPDIRTGNVVSCGVRPGYFASAYERIAEVCEIAISWGVEIVVA